MSDLREAVEGLRDWARAEASRYASTWRNEFAAEYADRLTAILDAHPDQEGRVLAAQVDNAHGAPVGIEKWAEEHRHTEIADMARDGLFIEVIPIPSDQEGEQ